jgi:hypothetical protein
MSKEAAYTHTTTIATSQESTAAIATSALILSLEKNKTNNKVTQESDRKAKKMNDAPDLHNTSESSVSDVPIDKAFGAGKTLKRRKIEDSKDDDSEHETTSEEETEDVQIPVTENKNQAGKVPRKRFTVAKSPAVDRNHLKILEKQKQGERQKEIIRVKTRKSKTKFLNYFETKDAPQMNSDSYK